MLNILWMIITLIILFIIILLWIGVKITLTYDKKGSEVKGCLKILILKKIKIYSANYPSKEEESEDEEDDDDEETADIFELVKPCFGYFKEFIKSLMTCISITKLENHLIFGLDSYADTAKYIGYIWSILIIVNSSHKKARISAEPSFNGSVFDGYGTNEVDINILKLIPHVTKLVLKKEVRELIKGVING